MVAYTAADLPAQGSSPRGRGAYMIERELDIAAQIVTNGADYAAGDTETMLNVPKGTVVLSAGIEVLTSASGTTATVDLGFTGGVVDKFVDRSNIGYEKYGQTLHDERTSKVKNLADYLNDIQEELMDAVLYLQKAKEKYEAQSSEE